MPSVILEKLKETENDIKLTTEEGSWFGKLQILGVVKLIFARVLPSGCDGEMQNS